MGLNWTYTEIVNKYTKHIILSEDEELREFLPDTIWFGKKNLKKFLKKYKVVYLKPSRGTGGRGIFKVEKKKENGIWTYSYHFKKKKQVFQDFIALYRALRKKMKKVNKKKRKYLIQQGIDLLKHEDCLFDVRSLAQINPHTKIFECNGLLVRVGHPSKIVTNISNSGYPKNFFDVFSVIIAKDEVKKLKEELERLSVKMASVLRSQYEEINQVGFDFGFDQNLKIWLIEMNIKPRYKGFRKIDMDVYEKIDRRANELQHCRSS